MPVTQLKINLFSSHLREKQWIEQSTGPSMKQLGAHEIEFDRINLTVLAQT